MAASLLFGSETVLLVEDEDVVRELVRAILEANGYTVLEARHGAEALRVYEEHGDGIDLLLTDVVMPNMGGRELAKRLALTRPELRVLFMSGYADAAVAQHGVLEPGTAFIQKPFSTVALAQRVREILDAPPALARELGALIRPSFRGSFRLGRRS